jgi:cation diffusion facilitator CzcD-associated flavoprotein CzcO
VPAILYQFSFAPNPDWSHYYARGGEIHAYTKGLVDQFGLADHLRLNEGITEARWNAETRQWHLTTAKGVEEVFDAIVPALGQLSRPTLPDIAGIDSFTGAKWHAAEWPEGVDLTGKRVGVVGSAASAVQLIPEIAKQAAHLTVFQRSANWCIPRRDFAVSDQDKQLLGTNIEVAMRLGAMQRQMIFDNAEAFFWQAFEWTEAGREAIKAQALAMLEEQVSDPEMRARLIPDYPVGCKRVLITSDFYPALVRDNVTLETDGIVGIEPSGIRTQNAVHELDVIVFATGFETTQWDWSMTVTGENGQTLTEAWAEGPEAYLGIMVAGFPNMFMLYGPNTNLGHNSISFMIECQVGYMLNALASTTQSNAHAISVSAAAQRDFNATLQQRLAGTAWADPHCNSWYKSADGRISQNWGGNCTEYQAATQTVATEHMEFS